MNLSTQFKNLTKLEDAFLCREKALSYYESVKRDKTRGMEMSKRINNERQEAYYRSYLNNRDISTSRSKGIAWVEE